MGVKDSFCDREGGNKEKLCSKYVVSLVKAASPAME